MNAGFDFNLVNQTFPVTFPDQTRKLLIFKYKVKGKKINLKIATGEIYRKMMELIKLEESNPSDEELISAGLADFIVMIFNNNMEGIKFKKEDFDFAIDSILPIKKFLESYISWVLQILSNPTIKSHIQQK